MIKLSLHLKIFIFKLGGVIFTGIILLIGLLKFIAAPFLVDLFGIDFDFLVKEYIADPTLFDSEVRGKSKSFKMRFYFFTEELCKCN